MHWLLVGSEVNFNISRERGYDVAGMKERWRKAAAEVRPGDTVFFYLLGLKAIGGEAKVVSEAYFDSAEDIWECSHLTEKYPWRFATEPVAIREPGDYLAVLDFLADYEYAQKWSPKRWGLAFQGNVHRLNDNDYQLIHDML